MTSCCIFPNSYTIAKIICRFFLFPFFLLALLSIPFPICLYFLFLPSVSSFSDIPYIIYVVNIKYCVTLHSVQCTASGAHKLCKTGINIPKNVLSTREYEGNMLFMRARRLGYKHQGVDAPDGMCTGGWGTLSASWEWCIHGLLFVFVTGLVMYCSVARALGM
jgi:hypothetical protein